MTGPMRRGSAWLLALAGIFAVSIAGAQPRRQTPYWASINSGEAMMRVGPGRNYRGIWKYVRRDLPVRVIDVYQDWRKIEDPDGTTGWMLVSLLSDTRTAIVRGSEPRPMYEDADERSALRYRAEPGVVGRISHCNAGWCRIKVGGRAGYIRMPDIWGVGQEEQIN